MRAREAGQRSVASTLPAPSTLLIGRDQDVAAARERLLAPHVRLLTFTGPAGTGKTRLALAVAAGVQAEFADGIHFVDLAPIRDSTLVLTAIAQVLGVRDAGDQPLRQTLLLYVQPRQLALMLDNFEQVIDAAPLVRGDAGRKSQFEDRRDQSRGAPPELGARVARSAATIATANGSGC